MKRSWTLLAVFASAIAVLGLAFGTDAGRAAGGWTIGEARAWIEANVLMPET